MSVYTLDAAIGNVRNYVNEYRKEKTLTFTEDYIKFADAVNHMIIEYGKVSGELKIKFPDNLEILNENGKKSEAAFAIIAKSKNRSEKINDVIFALSPCSELVAIGKTLVERKKEEKSKIDDLDKRVNSLYSDFNKIKDVVDEISKNLHK